MHRLGTARHKVAEVRHMRALAANTMFDNQLPNRDAFGEFGVGASIVAPVRLGRADRIFLGDGATILEFAFLSVVEAVEGYVPTFRVGSRTRIGRMLSIACVGHIELGEDCLVGQRVFIGDTYHRYQDPEQPVLTQPMAEPEPVVIDRRTYLGDGVAVVAGVHIGESAHVTSGSLVSADVEPFTMVAGNPARPIRRWDVGAGAWRPTGP